MNHDFLIKTTNRVALYATGALFYWVFAFLIITVFDLKIFRERMTEMFFLSLLGIFAILAGAIVLNVMSNLSKISAAAAPAPAASTQGKKKMSRGLIIMLVSFPLIAAALFGGNHLSAQRKERMLVASAERLIAENQTSLAALANYTFSEEYVVATEATLGVLNKIDRNFPELMLIVPDSIDGKNLYLGFSGRGESRPNNEDRKKVTYLYSTTQDERDYISKVYAGTQVAYKFNAEKGNYQLYYPATVGGKKIVLYFSDFQRYGKFGS